MLLSWTLATVFNFALCFTYNFNILILADLKICTALCHAVYGPKPHSLAKLFVAHSTIILSLEVCKTDLHFTVELLHCSSWTSYPMTGLCMLTFSISSFYLRSEHTSDSLGFDFCSVRWLLLCNTQKLMKSNVSSKQDRLKCWTWRGKKEMLNIRDKGVSQQAISV